MWEELAAALKDDPSVVVAEVECPDAKKICDEVGVKGFPTIASSFGGEKKEVFKGARTLGPLEKFARWVFVFDGRRLLAGLAALDCSRLVSTALDCSRLLSTSRYSLLALPPTRCQIARDPLDVRDGAVVILLNDSLKHTKGRSLPPSESLLATRRYIRLCPKRLAKIWAVYPARASSTGAMKLTSFSWIW